MKKKLDLTDSTWFYGSYPRVNYKKDMLYTFYQYKDFQAVYNMGHFDIQDNLVNQMDLDGLVAPELKKEYLRQVYRFMEQMERYDTWPVEKIYGRIHQTRKQFISARALEREQRLQIDRGCAFDPKGSIDQTGKKLQLTDRCRAFLFALCQPELFFLMKEDIARVLACQGDVYILVNDSKGNGLPSRELMQEQIQALPRSRVHYLTDEDHNLSLNLSAVAWDETLQQHIDTSRAALFVYGEEGLLHCRNLRIPAVVHARPYSYFARAMTNQLDGAMPCIVYVPPHFDITRWVRLTEKTVISYWQLARLWEDQGDDIYAMTVEQLYRMYPQYFINIYASGERCLEALDSYPIRLDRLSGRRGIPADRPKDSSGGDVFSRFYSLKDKAVSDYLGSRKDLTYISTYFDGDFQKTSGGTIRETPIPWCSATQQNGILVQGIRTKKAGKSQVIRCTRPLRRQITPDKNALLLLSNFLFFLTPKLESLYNGLRSDRPREQAALNLEHLDYMLHWKDQRRTETFPLYHKACIAMTADGNFLFFRYRLGGGTADVNGFSLRWASRDVDPDRDTDHPVIVYTPYGSRKDQDQESRNYRLLVGTDRINLVVVQNRVVCVRKGDVILPSIGVALSLDQSTGEAFLNAAGLKELENGYYHCDELEIQIHLDGPAQIPKDQWSQVRWAFGGGMSLILNGESMFGTAAQNGSRFLEEEGWMSPLSRQTQETEVHKMARHPRTAVGTTKNGDFFVLVFSGRTLLSAGADYSHMCTIAKKLFPDVQSMMNVDGGGSSMLGASIGGSFMELSYPATSMGSCAGMVRQINTVLCLEQ